MGTVIKKNVVDRKPGKLYYIDGKGNVCEATMKNGRKKAAKKTTARKTPAKRKTAKKRTTKRRTTKKK